MPGENEFNMASALAEISDGLGFDDGGDDGGNDTAAVPADGTANRGGDSGAADPVGTPAGGEAAESGAESAPGEQSDATGTPGEASGPEPTAAPAPQDLTVPPKTWRKEATAEWAALPESARREIHKREEDMHRGLAQYKSGAEFGWQIQRAVQPFDNLLQQFGVTPQQVIPGLMNAHATLTIGGEDQKLSMIETLIKDYRIPLPALLAKLTGGALDNVTPFVDPAVQALQDKLARVESTLSAREQAAQNDRQQQFRAEVAKFASDPAHIYFDDLSEDIAQFLRSGVATDLKTAYEKALWANPTVRAKELQRQSEAEAAERARKASEAAGAARKATAANLKSTAKSGGPTAKPTSIDETLEETLRAIQARG